MKKIRTAVVGAGHLGRIHARILKTLGDFELVAVIDPVEAARNMVAEQFGVAVDDDHRRWLDRVDAVIVAAPTKFHHAVTRDFLEAGIPAFVEKPICSSIEEAEELVECAMLRRLALQVGHVERFNPAWNAVRPHLNAPTYIECVREGVFSFRSTDVGVVLDLMIHDIDLVLDLVKSRVVDVEACGTALLGSREDVAHARIRFENGCIAVLNASRVSHVATRQMKVRTADTMATIDFNSRTATMTRIHESLLRGDLDVERLSHAEKLQVKEVLLTTLLKQETLEAAPRDAIAAELQDFSEAIRTGRRPTVSGIDGLEALRVATKVVAAIQGPQEMPTRETKPKILTGPHWHLRSNATMPRREAG
ncbi:MAG: Gfo/Idh/MocA family oxidoreductase [Planctomycetia bacterium]|nr:Gfo/Idh/MocA family oxidoreductase [Planctomycetia bacterium]